VRAASLLILALISCSALFITPGGVRCKIRLVPDGRGGFLAGWLAGWVSGRLFVPDLLGTTACTDTEWSSPDAFTKTAVVTGRVVWSRSDHGRRQAKKKGGERLLESRRF